MKKKNLLVLGLVGIMAVASVGTVFADTAVNLGRGEGFGNGIHLQYDTVEERLEAKLQLIDQLVKEGKLTAEKGKELKAIIEERMDNCDELGSMRESNERLGIGFGRVNGAGQGKRLGAQDGTGRGFGRR